MITQKDELPPAPKNPPVAFKLWYSRRKTGALSEEIDELGPPKHSCHDCTHYESTYVLRCRLASGTCVNSRSRPYFEPIIVGFRRRDALLIPDTRAQDFYE